jgi:hypothetical protein
MDTSSGNPTSFAPRISAYAFSLAARGSKLYVGGVFGDWSGSSNLAVIDLASGAADERGPAVYGYVRAIVPGPGSIHLGGSISSFDGRRAGLLSFSAVAQPLRIQPGTIAVGESTLISLSGDVLDECSACRLRSGAAQREIPLDSRSPGVVRSALSFARSEIGSWNLECDRREGGPVSGNSISVVAAPPPRVRIRVSGRSRVRVDTWNTYVVTLEGDSLRSGRGRVEIPLLNVADWRAETSSLTAFDGHGGRVLATSPWTVRPGESRSFSFQVRSHPEPGPFGLKARWVPEFQEAQP